MHVASEFWYASIMCNVLPYSYFKSSRNSVCFDATYAQIYVIMRPI